MPNKACLFIFFLSPFFTGTELRDLLRCWFVQCLVVAEPVLIVNLRVLLARRRKYGRADRQGHVAKQVSLKGQGTVE